MFDTRVAPVEELTRCFVIDLQREIASVPSNRPFSLAVPGGSVAHAFFPALATADIDWLRVKVFFVDERAVPPNSPESNYGLANRLWLTPANVPSSHVFRMHAEESIPSIAAESYAKELRSVAGAPPRLDYVLLGAGADGHVASLFTSDASFRMTADGSVGWTTNSPKPPPLRMSLTFPTLANASRLVVAAFGSDKAPAVATALLNETSSSPLATLLHAAKRTLVLLDPAAGGRKGLAE